MLEVIEICWILLLLLSQVRGGVNLSPKGGFFPRGSNITLICTAKDAPYVLWTEKETTETIFVNKEKISKNEKYANFYMSSQTQDDYSLEISHADVSDDGAYVCQGHSNSTEATIVIEAKPTLSINIGGNDGYDYTSLTSLTRHAIRISCLAKGAKPAVKLKLKINDGDWMQPVDHNITKRGDLYDSYIKSGIVVLTAKSSITCHASGQQSIADVNHTEIIYAPICNISQDISTVKCYCIANPPVFKSTLLVNGFEKHTNALKFQKYIPADFTCSGANYIGNGLSTIFIGATSEQRKSRKLSYAVIATVCVVTVSLVAMVRWFQRRKGYSVSRETHWEVENQNGNTDLPVNEKCQFRENQQKEDCDRTRGFDRKANYSLQLENSQELTSIFSTVCSPLQSDNIVTYSMPNGKHWWGNYDVIGPEEDATTYSHVETANTFNDRDKM